METTDEKKIKIYIHIYVSAAMQIDGYSLAVQKSGMKAYAEFNDYEIVGEYKKIWYDWMM